MDIGKIADGVYLTNTAPAILVEDSEKLALIVDAQPGTIAYTAGYGHMWQLDTDGTTWVQIV